MKSNHVCDYCGLSFSGSGYSPDEETHFCCYGCFLVQRILGKQGEEGLASFILLRLGIGAFLSMNVMMISLILYTTALEPDTLRGFHWALLAVSTPAILILTTPFAMGAIREFRRGKLSMDALITTGSLAAYAGSALHTIRGAGPVYFDTATMLPAIITLGRLLEASARMRTSQVIRRMLEETPESSLILRNGDEVKVPSNDVKPGDWMVVKPGERIPADGRIVSGECLIDESAFTGESKPRTCRPGDTVRGGSISCDGRIVVEATATSAESFPGRVQKMVREALEIQAPVERLAERISAGFVPFVWTAAVAAFLYWTLMRGNPVQGGLSALALMVAACPCALGLATPMATCLAIGRAAREGVLIASGEVLERLPRIRKLYFDKTGTLTENRLSVAGVVSDGITPDELLSLAASLEAGSEHAIARAIVTEARSEKLALGEIRDIRIFPGRGVIGTVVLDGQMHEVSVGSEKLVSPGAAIEPVASSACGERSAWECHTPTDLTAIYVSLNNQLHGMICLQDTLRRDARETIAALQEMGIRTAILSGDQEGPTKRLAGELEIEEIHFGMSPEEKSALVQSGGIGTAMVGDGINDAPALAAADVGFAMHTGTDLARQAGSIMLLGDDLTRIPRVISLAGTTCKIIRQNLWWAFGYNSAAMLLAFFGFIHPLIAAITMVASSLFVIGNSIRISRF